MKKDTLIIILNWRQPEMTIECIASIQQMKQVERCDILVVDNGSGDDSVAMIRRSQPDIIVWALSENLGFGRGNNKALDWAATQHYTYALLINNDAFPHPDMLDHLYQHTSPEIALLSPKIYYDEERRRIWFAGAVAQKYALNIRQTGRGELDQGQYDENRICDYLLGACLLVNLRVLSDVGGFDDLFFMYYEDLDWSIRLCQANYQLMMVAQAHLYHRVAVSSGGLDSPFRLYHMAKSSVIFWQRHAAKGSPLLIFLYRFGHAVKLSLKLVHLGKIAELKAYWRGLRDGWHISRRTERSLNTQIK